MDIDRVKIVSMARRDHPGTQAIFNALWLRDVDCLVVDTVPIMLDIGAVLDRMPNE